MWWETKGMADVVIIIVVVGCCKVEEDQPPVAVAFLLNVLFAQHARLDT
jgi:hypothetical protein